MANDMQKLWAWQNARPHPSGDALWRLDPERDDLSLYWHDHGSYGPHGWHVDHIQPKELGGEDWPWNVRARHWQTNTSAGGLLAAALTRPNEPPAPHSALSGILAGALRRGSP